MKKLALIFSALIVCLNAFADDLKNNLKEEFQSEFYAKMDKFSKELSSALANKLRTHERIKYLDISIGLQEKLKPTFEIQSINKLREETNSVWFNQTNILSHDGDTTINLGIGRRELFNNETLMTGYNGFLDYQIDEGHFRKGLGFEAVSSKLDLIGNYYDAISDAKDTDEGQERALDGYDVKLNFHLNNIKNTDLFAQLFEWENPDSTYKQTGEKFGLTSVIGNFSLRVGYLNDNKNNDGYFGSIKLVIPLGKENTRINSKNNNKEQLSMRKKLYMPVHRENKIKLVKISSGVQVGGF